MSHEWDARFDRAADIICETHGIASSECRHIHRMKAIGTTAAFGAAVGALLNAKKGAWVGGLVGASLGAAHPEFADWLRANQLNEAVHFFGP